MDPAIEARMRAEAMARLRKAFPDDSEEANPIRDQAYPELAAAQALARMAEHVRHLEELVRDTTENLDAALVRLEELHAKNAERLDDLEHRVDALERPNQKGLSVS